MPSVTYRGSLVAVDVGDARRPVSPPVELYFLTPDPLPGAQRLIGIGAIGEPPPRINRPSTLVNTRLTDQNHPVFSVG